MSARRWLFGLAVIGVGLSAPVFRATLYPRIPVHPGDPYGLGDILELGLGLLTLGTAVLLAMASAAVALVPRWRRRFGVMWLFAGAVIIAALYHGGMYWAARPG